LDSLSPSWGRKRCKISIKKYLIKLVVWIKLSICFTGWWEPSWLRLYRFSLRSWRLCSQLERLRRAFTALATGNSDTPIRYVCLMIKIFD
jgi:hypothetical protein